MRGGFGAGEGSFDGTAVDKSPGSGAYTPQSLPGVASFHPRCCVASLPLMERCSQVFTCHRCGLSPSPLNPTQPGLQSWIGYQMILLKMLNELLFFWGGVLALWERAVLFLSGSKSRATFVTLLAETLIPLHGAGRRREGKGCTISNLGQWDWKCVWLLQLLKELEATWGIRRPPPWALLQIDKKTKVFLILGVFSFCLYVLLHNYLPLSRIAILSPQKECAIGNRFILIIWYPC